ncbi:MAG: glutamyl-tRNA reductase [Candidatus Omnitrophota bacterium]
MMREANPKYFLVVTLNHKNISLKDLNQFSIPQGDMDRLLLHLMNTPFIEEVVGLCTCNRTEFYAGVNSVKDAAHAFAHELADYTGLTLETLRPSLTVIADAEAVEHLLRLASGLESMVIGDAQILGQVKEAYTRAAQLGVVEKTFHTLFQRVFSVAKRVRNETGLGKGRMSIAALAVEWAGKAVPSWRNVVATVIGAGKMGGLAAKYLKDAGVKELRIANRSPEKSIELANELGGKVYGLDEMDRILAESDVIVSTTSSPEPLITLAAAEKAAKARPKKRILIDVTLTPDIERSVEEVEGVTLVDLEALRLLAQENEKQRSEQYQRAEQIIEEELDVLMPWSLPLHIDALAASMGEYAKEICEDELQDLLDTLPDLSLKQKEIIEAKMKKLSERIILMPRRNLRQFHKVTSCPNACNCLSELFNTNHGARTAPGMAAVKPLKD